MLPRIPMPRELTQLISAQHGAVTTRQAMAAGLSREAFRRISTGWLRVVSGLYIVGQPTWRGFAHAALLRGGDGACLGGSAACFEHGVIRRGPSMLTVWTRRPHEPIAAGGLVARFRRSERHAFGTPRKVRLEEALLDHAEEASEFAVVEAVTRAIASRRTTAPRVRAAMEQRSRQARRALLEQIVDHAEGGIQSVLEWLFEQQVAQPHRLPTINRQVVLVRRNHVDVYFRDFGVIVELDGREFHDADKDARRDNRHALEVGAVTLRFTWQQVMHEPCAVASTIVEALRVRGWRGGSSRCRRCP